MLPSAVSLALCMLFSAFSVVLISLPTLFMAVVARFSAIFRLSACLEFSPYSCFAFSS